MGDKESRKPLSNGRKAELAALSYTATVTPAEEAQNAHQLVLSEVEAILSDRNRKGYFRVGISNEGAYWVRYKWTNGPLVGKYTFGSGDTVGLAFDQVVERVYACESGKRHAHTDEGYRPKKP